jgi:hypothetical protein
VVLRAKPLEEWITLSEAAKILSVSPQAVHQMCESGVIPEDNLRQVGRGKPIFLVLQSYVDELAQHRSQRRTQM